MNKLLREPDWRNLYGISRQSLSEFSPVFFLQVQTPVLIMHNDKDGPCHVGTRYRISSWLSGVWINLSGFVQLQGEGHHFEKMGKPPGLQSPGDGNFMIITLKRQEKPEWG